jgi:hypothetical protein
LLTMFIPPNPDKWDKCVKEIIKVIFPELPFAHAGGFPPDQ